jgi:hypothetical protein
VKGAAEDKGGGEDRLEREQARVCAPVLASRAYAEQEQHLPHANEEQETQIHTRSDCTRDQIG